mgnify:FL=1
MKKNSLLKQRLNMLMGICLLPLVVIIIYLIIMIYSFADRYDAIVGKIEMANAYNINFKDDMDYIMYIIAVNSERAKELVDTQKPHEMIDDARQSFQKMYDATEDEYAKNQLTMILKALDTLEDRVEEIEKDALISGQYDKNMERLDVNIRILTQLIQDQIQQYIYYQATNLENLRSDIRMDVDQATRTVTVSFVLILAAALIISRKIMLRITKPIESLCEATRIAGQGDFAVRAKGGNDDEMAILSTSFNQMVEQIGNLVEGIKVEQLNLKATELKLLQAQINPHFLYNTLDTIIWLAEAGEKEQVVNMVSSLSDFFRTTLSKGQDFITVQEEELHIQSYLQIQQFRYQDILEYEIEIPEELYQYKILKMTLQPLVENALYHGIKNKRRLGHIRISGQIEGDYLIFEVYDDGSGIDPEKLIRLKKVLDGEIEEKENPSGFGLYNVQQRICLNYGQGYGLQLESEYGEWTRVYVRIPCNKIKHLSLIHI